MSERIILQADLSKIEATLYNLHSGLANVDVRMDAIGAEVVTIEDKLTKLAARLEEFIRKDLLEKQKQFAQTKLIEVRQTLEKEFGHYAEVRKRTTGILQATDVGIVRQETITTLGEESMVNAPRYWLAPCLVALSAWLSDKPDLAAKAIAEADRRDQEKTALLMSLICRRLGRYEASSAWLDRFFLIQDPTELQRDVVVMIDAVACGIFGADARNRCSSTMRTWIAELSNRAGFLEAQRDQWKNALWSKLSPPSNTSFTYLPKHADNWSKLSESMQGATLHGLLLGYFEGIFEAPQASPKAIVVAVDDLLDKLVGEFDREELPLRREERLQQMVIELDGDRDGAIKKAGLEQTALAETRSFTQLLADSAMHADLSKASATTQRYAIALSKDWILNAHQDLTLANRSGVPRDIPVTIDDWKGVAGDGSEETALIQSISEHYQRKEDAAIASVKLEVEYVGLVLGGIMLLYGAFTVNWLLILLGGAGVGWFFYARSQLEKRRQAAKEQIQRLRDQSQQILKACLAEIVDWRRRFAKEDRCASDLDNYIMAIAAEEHVSTQHDSGRTVVQEVR